MVREYITNPTNTETATYLAGPRGPEYRRSEVSAGTNTTTSTRWYAYDGLGSVLGEIDGDAGSSTFGDLKKSRVYDAYGTVRADDNAPSASNHRFVGGLGHPSAGETGLIYMRARYMDPAVGRFISEDPAGNGSNWFVYCNNDPVNGIVISGKADGGWWLLGMVFALGAVVDALLSNLTEGSESKWFLSQAADCAGNAIAAFSFALAGGNHPMNTLAQDKAWYFYTVAGSMGVKEADRLGRGFAFIAVAASFIYGLAVAGAVDATNDAGVAGYEFVAG